MVAHISIKLTWNFTRSGLNDVNIQRSCVESSGQTYDVLAKKYVYIINDIMLTTVVIFTTCIQHRTGRILTFITASFTSTTQRY